jgi:molecular chaperone GrpE
MRTWFENEAILQRVRDLLGRTEEEMRRVSETASPEVVSDAEDLPSVGLLQLMEAFTALRHELKLQTKSSRSLEESVRTALDGLDRAVEHLRSVQSREETAVAEAALPLVQALIELDEALERGERAFLLLEQQVMQDATRELDETLEQAFVQRSAWQQWRARPWHALVRETCRRHLTDLSQRLLTPLREGYEMIRARLQRLLAQQRIERFPCVGLRVDPALMNVIELVDEPDLPPETVVEELRPGYRWRGRVVRFAEVRAVCRRPLPATAQEPELEEDRWT